MLGVNPTMVRRLPMDTDVTVQGAVIFAGLSCVSRRAGVCGLAAVEAQKLGNFIKLQYQFQSWEAGLRYPQVFASVEAMLDACHCNRVNNREEANCFRNAGQVWEVTPGDANRCPGAVQLTFRLTGGNVQTEFMGCKHGDDAGGRNIN